MTGTTYRHGLLITLLGVLIISPDTLMIRLVDADPWTLMFWRGLMSGCVVLVWCALFDRRDLRHVPHMGPLGWSVVLSFAVGNLLFLYAVTHTLVANSLFLVSTSPVFSALIARFILREHVSARTWITIALALTGIGVIATGSLGGGAGRLDGDLAALGAAASMATSFSIARARKDRSTVPPMGLGALLGAVVALALAPTLWPAPGDWGPLLVMGLFISPMAFICLTIGPRHIPAAEIGLMLLLEAVFGPLLVWWFLAETPGPATLIGGAVILLTLLASNLWLALSTRR